MLFMEGDGEMTGVLEGREALSPVFDDLTRYEATTHFNGQSTVPSTATPPAVRATQSPTTCSRMRAVAKS